MHDIQPMVGCEKRWWKVHPGACDGRYLSDTAGSTGRGQAFETQLTRGREACRHAEAPAKADVVFPVTVVRLTRAAPDGTVQRSVPRCSRVSNRCRTVRLVYADSPQVRCGRGCRVGLGGRPIDSPW